MNNTINSMIRSTIITGLAFIAFIPLYVSGSLFFPFITGKAFVFRILVEIIFALWLVLILREKGTSVANTSKSVIPRMSTMNVLITVFTLIILIADLSGLNLLRSLWSNFERMEGWMIIAHLWGYFIVTTSILNTKENWHNFFNVILVAATITGIYGLFQFFGAAATHQGSRVDASLGNSAYMAIYMLINAFIALYLSIENYKNKVLFWVYAVCAAFLSFIMFQTATRGTIIAWLVAIFISAAIYTIFGKGKDGYTKNSRIISGGVLIGLVLVGVLFYRYRDAQWIKNNAVLGRLATISISDTKTQARGYIWPMAIKGVFENPKNTVIGIGQENFNYIFNSHYNPEMWRHEQWFDRAHSVYLDWLVAGGLLGLISYLALYVLALIYIIKSDITIGKKSVLIGLIIGYSIHNVFVFDNQTSYIMFFTVLAFINSLREHKTISLFKNYNKDISEDAVVVRDYIYMPVIVIALGVGIYFINVRPIQANNRLIASLQACTNIQTLSTKNFEKALSLNLTMANQEIREQLLSCSANILQSQQVPQDKKVEFFNLTKSEIERQIKDTPNDARIYIIAGGFYDSIREYALATPYLEKANTLSPNKQSIIFELASNYISTNRAKEAADILEKAYNSSTDHPDAKANYIAALVASGDEAKAKKLFGDDKKIFSDSRIVNAYMSSKQYGKAIAIYKDLLKDNPESQELYSSLVYAYILSGQNSLAIETLKTIQDKFPLLKTQAADLIKQIQDGKIKLP